MHVLRHTGEANRHTGEGRYPPAFAPAPAPTGTVCVIGPAQFGPALVSTTLAGAWASLGQAVMLAELAPHGRIAPTLDAWLVRRPSNLSPIRGWERVAGADSQRMRAPAGITHAVLHLHHDVPFHRLTWAVERSRAIIVTVGHAILARDLANAQLEALARQSKVQDGRCKLGLISVGLTAGCIAYRRTARWAEQQARHFKSLDYLGNVNGDSPYATWHQAGTQLFDYPIDQQGDLLPQWTSLVEWAARKE